MYLHPVGQYAELGLGGKGGRLVVWLFGTEWSTREVNLNLSQWYQLCLTWTQATVQPTLYINGEAEDVAAGGGEIKYICCPLGAARNSSQMNKASVLLLLLKKCVLKHTVREIRPL